LSNNFRPSDFIGRWAEDQFLVILTNCGGLGVERAFERVRSEVPRASIRWWGEQVVLTTSFGYAGAETGDTIDSLLQRAQRSGDLSTAPGGGPGDNRVTGRAT